MLFAWHWWCHTSRAIYRKGSEEGSFFFPSFPECCYYSKPFTSAFSSLSLFNLTVLVNLEHLIVASHGTWTASCIHTATLLLFSPKHINTITFLDAVVTWSWEVKKRDKSLCMYRIFYIFFTENIQNVMQNYIICVKHLAETDKIE